MFKLLAYTVGFSASDCLDPLAISVVIYLLTTARPILNSFCFLCGVVLTTFVAGLILSFGLIKEVDTILSHPQGLYFSFQLLVGVLIALGGWKYWNHAAAPEQHEAPIKITVNPLVAFILGVTFTTTDLPTNVPLIAVSEELVKNSASFITTILSCLAYSVVRVSPSLVLLGGFIVKREKSTEIIEKIQGPLSKWGHRVTAIIILGLGILLVADSIYYFTTDKALLVF